jgi:3-oxoacyl-[acyl-carrier-protein] synthase II
MTALTSARSGPPAAGPVPVPVAVTAWAVHVPGLVAGELAPGLGDTPAQPPERAHELLGRKGLRYRDDATRLALCAVHRALRLPVGAGRRAGAPDPNTAVVASCNLGTVALVQEIVRTVRARSGRDVSPLQAPNVSSNVVASTVALWFRWGGPNMMMCSGASAGLDAIAVGSLLLRAGRAHRVVVVGCEPGDPLATLMHAAEHPVDPLRASAAAVVLEPVTGSAPVLVAPIAVPGHSCQAVDVTGQLGDTYGACGVLGVALASARVAAGEPAPLSVICGNRAVRISR